MGLFKKVEETKTALKVLAYGKTSTGKTLFGLTFPSICAIDSEDGMTFYKKKYGNLKYILPTTSAIEVEEALDEVEELDGIKTFIIDSETKVYENMQHSALNIAERRARKKGQSVEEAGISVKEWGKIKMITKRIQSTKISLATKGVNIVSISQEKDLKEKKGDEWIITGHAPDGAKGIEYDYDIVLRFFTKKVNGDEKYFAEVKKDRTQTYKKGEIIENASFQNWKDIYDDKIDKREEIIDYKKDIKTDEKATEAEMELVENLIVEFKEIMNNLADTKKKQVKPKMDELGLTPKTLKNEDPEKIEELIKFVKGL